MTTKKRLLSEIAASASPAMRRKISEMALTETAMGREINCVEMLREVALGTVIMPASPQMQAEALEILGEIGLGRTDAPLFRAARDMPDSMKGRMSELALIGHLVFRGPKALLEACAIVTALDPNYAAEKDAAIKTLISLGTKERGATWIYRSILKTRLLPRMDFPAFKELFAAVEARQADPGTASGPEIKSEPVPDVIIRSSILADGNGVYTIVEVSAFGRDFVLDGNRSITCSQSIAGWSSLPEPELLSIVARLAAEKVISNSSELYELDRGLHEVLCSNRLIGRIVFPRRTPLPSAVTEPFEEGCQDSTCPPTLPSYSTDTATVQSGFRPPDSAAVSESSVAGMQSSPESSAPQKARRPETLSADELRKLDLAGMEMTKKIMYRLICVECFRLATSKAIIGNSYKPLVSVQSNLVRKLNGNRALKELFEDCWSEMVNSNAIEVRKTSTAASLNPRTDSITNADVRNAVKWAFSEHRRVFVSAPSQFPAGQEETC